MVWGGRLFNRDEIRSGKAKPNSVSGFCEGLYLGQEIGDPDMPDQFLNHSCDPNLWMTDEVTLVARRNIKPGDEITADYAMWEIDSDWRMDNVCNCGALLCRGMITGEDWRLKEIQMRYAGHFLPLINKRIVAINASDVTQGREDVRTAGLARPRPL